MILYNLVCAKGHEFESWFAGSAAYEKQAKRGLVECPMCGSTKVEKALMTPAPPIQQVRPHRAGRARARGGDHA